jgi:hypothetical protein
LQGQDLKLSLGSIDDYDDTYFNGVRVGGYGQGLRTGLRDSRTSLPAKVY